MDRYPQNLNQMKCVVIYFLYARLRERLKTLRDGKAFQKYVCVLLLESICCVFCAFKTRQVIRISDKFPFPEPRGIYEYYVRNGPGECFEPLGHEKESCGWWWFHLMFSDAGSRSTHERILFEAKVWRKNNKLKKFVFCKLTSRVNFSKLLNWLNYIMLST